MCSKELTQCIVFLRVDCKSGSLSICGIFFHCPTSSLQIIFVHKQVICQARVKFWLDKKPVWLDKYNFHSLEIQN